MFFFLSLSTMVKCKLWRNVIEKSMAAGNMFESERQFKQHMLHYFGVKSKYW